jgi:two-component system, chemotaxis family, protein-glutamate methylesterase/glutaminase
LSKIRVLVVDDAVVFRRLVADELSSDPQLEVVGTASNGRVALQRLTQVNPDVVILDIEMPEMDGLTALAELRKTHRRLPVVMFSSLTERGATATLDALALGASDYFTKPISADGVEGSLAIIRTQLIPKIKALCAGKVRPESTPSPPIIVPAPARRKPTGEIRVIAIGASTGGPNALAEIFARLPADLQVPIVIVQHMPPMFTRMLAERLTARSQLCVREATPGAKLEPGHAWVAPGDYHMSVVREGSQRRLGLNQDPPENSCRPAVDVLFRSVATAYGADSIGVILTGMGCDGLRGCEALREAGGQILAQDEATSTVWGMPGSVVRANLADRVLPLAMIADEIVRRVKIASVTP